MDCVNNFPMQMSFPVISRKKDSEGKMVKYSGARCSVGIQPRQSTTGLDSERGG